MTTDNQRARRARTVEARNGARVILPPETTTAQLWDFALREAYHDIDEPLRSDAFDAFLSTSFRMECGP